MVDPLERQFHEVLLDVYRQLSSEYGYRASRFLKMLSDHGAVETCQVLIHADAPSEGFTKLWEWNRLDLSVEALILLPEWRDLFTDEDREAAVARLQQYDFEIPSDSLSGPPDSKQMDTDESPPVFTPEVLNAWGEVVRRHNEGIPAEPKGQPDSIEDFRKRLAPYREAIKNPLEGLLHTISVYKELRVYNLQDFWRQNPKGALFQSHIRVVIASSQDKTLGRLQLTLCPERFVRCEYVANIATDQNREFQIERISRWLQRPDWFSEFRRGCLDLGYYGFKLQCTCGNGESIDTAFPDLTEKQWDSLHLHGLDCSEYFVIKYDRPLFPIRKLSVDGLAQLAVRDWSELSGLYPFLQGEAKTVGTGTLIVVSDTVERVRQNATPPRPGTFTPEFVGKKADYEIKGAIQPESNHGAVVNALYETLKQLGYVVTSDQQRDACIVGDNGEVAVLFEAKTDVVPYSVYTAVGQLMLHGAIQNPPPKRVFVSPEEPEQGTRTILERLGISVLTYEIQDDEIQFTGIENIGLLK